MVLVGYMLTFPSSASIRSLHLEGREKQQLHGAHNARSLKLTPNEPTAMQPVESEREREGGSEQNRKAAAAAVLVSSGERLNERRGEERKGREGRRGLS